MKRIAMPWGTTHAFTNPEASGKFVPRTPWVNAADAAWVRWVFEVAALQTNARLKFAYQFADVETSPDTAVALGTASSTDGFNRGSWNDIGAGGTNKQLIRFGYLTWNNSDGTLVCFAAGGFVEYRPAC